MKKFLLALALISGPAISADVCDPHDWKYLRTRVTTDLLHIYCDAIRARDSRAIDPAKCQKEINRIRYLMMKYQGFNGSTEEAKRICSFHK